ncbi:P-loop containing nucleoside triphosphate hydrolase protein [Sparassis latifolia]
MSLVNAAIRHRACLPAEVGASYFHTTSVPLLEKGRASRSRPVKYNTPPKTSPSRTRLVKDLTPRTNKNEKGKGKAGKLEVAPRAAFVRDPAPHPDARDMREERERQRELTRRFGQRRLRRASQETPRRSSSWDRDRDRDKDRDTAQSARWQEKKTHPLATRGLPDFDKPWRTSRGVAPPAAARGAEDGYAPAQRKTPVYNPLSDEFDVASKSVSTRELPGEFASPPLMEGLLTSVVDVLGPHAKPTPIQALALKHLFTPLKGEPGGKRRWHQCLLASETGSGKSIAYMLPMLQGLKQSEVNAGTSTAAAPDAPAPSTPLNPRALVLAPTHELARQLSAFAKALLHGIKLRVLCASQANLPSTPRHQVSAAQMARDADEGGEFGVHRGAAGHPVDVLVGTPARVLEMAKGRGWDFEQPKPEDHWGLDEKGRAARRPKAWTVGKPEMGLSRVEWVVVDEADVLFDPDFQESTRRILAEISVARGHPVPFEEGLPQDAPQKPLDYPFNLLLTTATIPSALASYLDTHHPGLMRLASPHLHHLPQTLKTEYAAWTGGNRYADIEHRLRRVWAEDLMAGGGRRSKVLIFCNKSTKVQDLGRHLNEKGIPNVALTSTSDTRKHGSNHHLDGFLRVRGEEGKETEGAREVGEDEPHVMITTSLLSRGLDFAPDIRNVFIVDEPRNMVDFLHRAGRAGRAGALGKVVVFGKAKGRGSLRTKDMRKKVGALTA